MEDFNLDTNEKITTGFKIPDNYFVDFSERVMKQLPIKETLIISFYARNKKWIFSAAALLVLVLSLPLVYQMENSEEQLSALDIENYITQQSTISDDEIINLLEQEDINQLKINTVYTKIKLTNKTDIENQITN
jgi:hypothetical protein